MTTLEIMLVIATMDAVEAAGGPVTLSKILAAAEPEEGYVEDYRRAAIEVTEVVAYTLEGDPLRYVKAEGMGLKLGGLKDVETAEVLLNDPFHTGLDEHGEFQGFNRVKEPKGQKPLPPMTDDEIEASRARMDRLADCNPAEETGA